MLEIINTRNDMEQQTEIFNKLRAWIVSKGGYVNDKIALSGNAQNRFLYATSNIDKQELLIRLPRECGISPSRFDKLPQAQTVTTDGSIVLERVKVALSLLYEKILGRESEFALYIDMLPKYEDFSYHPMYVIMTDPTQRDKWNRFSPEFVRYLDSQLMELKQMRACVQAMTVAFAGVSEEMIRWAYLNAVTREWTIAGMFPLMDMVQHSNQSTLMPDINDKNANLIANITVAEGGAIYLSYGHQCGIEMLAVYGFVDDIHNDNCPRYSKVHIDPPKVPEHVGAPNDEERFLQMRDGMIQKYMARQKLYVFGTQSIQQHLMELVGSIEPSVKKAV